MTTRPTTVILLHRAGQTDAVRIPGAGHAWNETHPELFADVITEAVTSIRCDP